MAHKEKKPAPQPPSRQPTPDQHIVAVEAAEPALSEQASKSLYHLSSIYSH